MSGILLNFCIKIRWWFEVEDHLKLLSKSSMKDRLTSLHHGHFIFNSCYLCVMRYCTTSKIRLFGRSALLAVSSMTMAFCNLNIRSEATG